MAEVWVVNASPLIALAQVSALDLLPRLASDVIVPDAVVDEVCAGAAGDPARRALEQGWGTRASNPDVPPSIVEWSLGRGESAVIAIAAARRGCVAVLDDAEARACARAHGVALVGTLGVVLRAKRTGLIASAVALLRQLREVGFHLDDATIAAALAGATDERWVP